MILQALVRYYNELAQEGEIARPGWGKVKVSYALELDDAGELIEVHSLKVPAAKGKKLVARELLVPTPKKRTVAVLPNFLCDNSAYILGFDGKGKPKRAQECFQAAKTLHETLLNASEEASAKAVCRFFANWNPETAREQEILSEVMEDLAAGANLVFLHDGVFLHGNPSLVTLWQSYYDSDGEAVEHPMRCLVSGALIEPTATHPAIKGVRGAQSSGAALVSFNAPAYCSYNREQNLNAPVGKAAAFAYTTALNHLLSQRDGEGKPRFSKLIGDTTVVFWAEGGEEVYQDALACMLDGESNTLEQKDLEDFMNALSKGEAISWENFLVKPDNRFYILGLSPNAARLSVRFFLQDNFGNFVRHLKAHYERLAIVKPAYDKFESIPLWRLLSETVNQKAKDKSPSPQMAGDTLRAILNGGSYPATLYQQTMLRIKAERSINRCKAAIIKAYLLQYSVTEEQKEALTVDLNEQTTYQPYVLGRLFSVLENIQESASGVTTIKDKYFVSASTTPAVVFPIIMSLAEKHLRKLDTGTTIYFSRQMQELTGRITTSYPKHFSLTDQGIFQLGYYHQTQKRYEKKSKED